MATKGKTQRFRVLEFVNRSGTKSWRVTGTKRDGARVRENFSEPKAAQVRHLELETEFMLREARVEIRATKLTDSQLRFAEIAFLKLDADADLLPAVDHWLRHGKAHAVTESPRLDEAVEAFCGWVDQTPALRDRTKANLRTRVSVFSNSISNIRVSTMTPEVVEAYLAGRKVSSVSRSNDLRAISRFFSWCMERPRRWVALNPAHGVKVEHEEKGAPEVLSVEDCQALLAAAAKFKDGRLVPYLGVCLFAGLRPFEASRLSWSQVNLVDHEIRLEANQTKTGRSRVIRILPVLEHWLRLRPDGVFFPSNWRKDFAAVKAAAGFGTPTKALPALRPWVEDVMRHTAISHFFRLSRSYGETAEWAGNSEAIIKAHYQGRVSSADTERFWNLSPEGVLR